MTLNKKEARKIIFMAWPLEMNLYIVCMCVFRSHTFLTIRSQYYQDSGRLKNMSIHKAIHTPPSPIISNSLSYYDVEPYVILMQSI